MTTSKTRGFNASDILFIALSCKANLAKANITSKKQLAKKYTFFLSIIHHKTPTDKKYDKNINAFF